VNLRFNYVTPTYFDLMQIPMLAGRSFQDGDPSVAIINESAAHRLFPDANPIGRHIAWRTVKPETEIVGVVKDAKYSGIRQQTPAMVYVPARESNPFEPSLHIRTAGEPRRLVPLIRREAAALDPSVTIFNVKTLEEQVDQSITGERMSASVSSLLSLLALLLAAVGLYGVIAFTVVRRTREIGIRMALGASRESVIAGVLRRTAPLVGIGIVCGAAVSAACGHLVESLLYGVHPNDSAAYFTVIAAVLFVSAAAAMVPALRAARVDPMVALRQD
jgi:predicted permease